MPGQDVEPVWLLPTQSPGWRLNLKNPPPLTAWRCPRKYILSGNTVSRGVGSPTDSPHRKNLSADCCTSGHCEPLRLFYNRGQVLQPPSPKNAWWSGINLVKKLWEDPTEKSHPGSFPGCPGSIKVDWSMPVLAVGLRVPLHSGLAAGPFCLERSPLPPQIRNAPIKKSLCWCLTLSRQVLEAHGEGPGFVLTCAAEPREVVHSFSYGGGGE